MWHVTPNVVYLRYSTEFQEIAETLESKAKKRDLDGATLAYVKMTMNCVNCHKLVRENKFVSMRTIPEATIPVGIVE